MYKARTSDQFVKLKLTFQNSYISQLSTVALTTYMESVTLVRQV